MPKPLQAISLLVKALARRPRARPTVTQMIERTPRVAELEMSWEKRRPGGPWEPNAKARQPRRVTPRRPISGRSTLHTHPQAEGTAFPSRKDLVTTGGTRWSIYGDHRGPPEEFTHVASITPDGKLAGFFSVMLQPKRPARTAMTEQGNSETDGPASELFRDYLIPLVKNTDERKMLAWLDRMADEGHLKIRATPAKGFKYDPGTGRFEKENKTAARLPPAGKRCEKRLT